MPYDPANDLYALLGILDDSVRHERLERLISDAIFASHPDRNHDDPRASRRTAQLLEARRVLLDPARRAEYDKARDEYFAQLPKVSDAPPPAAALARREPRRRGGPPARLRPDRPGALALTVAKVSLGAAALSLVVALVAYLTYRAARRAARSI